MKLVSFYYCIMAKAVTRRPFRWVWRLHRELEPSTRAAVKGPEGLLNGRHPSRTSLGKFLLHYPPA